MILETKRLLIRKFLESDLEDLAKILANAEVMRFSVTGPLPFEKTKNYFHLRILGHYTKGFGLYALICKEDSHLIGFAGFLTQQVDGEEKIELGYRIHPDYWGKGLASEACRVLAHYAFETLHLDEFISIIDPENIRSLRLAKGLGMHLWKRSEFHKIPVEIYILKKIALEPYQKDWTPLFEKEKKKLQDAFKGLPIQFYHIGSTSIPECSAKPIIDILGVTGDVTLIDKYNERLFELDYESLGEYGMKQRRFFRKKKEVSVNLHIFETTDPEVERHLRFCNYLRNHPEKTREYSHLKEELSKRFPSDMTSYVKGKDQFIKEIDLLAAEGAHFPIHPKVYADKKKNWPLEEIQKALIVNTSLYHTYFAKYLANMQFVFHPEVAVIVSEIPHKNLVFATRFTSSNSKARIQEIRKIFKKPFSWIISSLDTPSELGELLLSEGFNLEDESVGMYLEEKNFSTPSSTALSFRQVESTKELREFATPR